MSEIDFQFRDKTVCVLGLGYVGLTLAATLADVGFKVLGIEIRDDVLRMLQDGAPHFYEPGLKEKLGRVVRNGNLEFYKKIPKGNSATVYIITVGTPLGTTGHARLDMIENISAEIATHLKEGDLVIVRSTVMLGTTRRVVKGLLDKAGVKYDLAFCPERTVEGQALRELRELPQIVGGLNFESTVRAAQFFQMTTPTVVRVDNMETAEMIKMVDNVQRDVGFAFSNEVARMCDAAGISALQVISAGKLGYPRTNLPLPGLVGGPCLEKDTHIFAEGMSRYGVVPEVSLKARRLNENQPMEVVTGLRAITDSIQGFATRPTITLMGIAFKGRPVTDDLRGTMARPVFAALKEKFPDATFRGFDPVVSKTEIQAFGLNPCETIERGFEGSDLVVILNNHPLFSSMPVENMAGAMNKPGLIYDFWNNFVAKSLHLPNGVGYLALGSHGQGILPDLKGASR